MSPVKDHNTIDTASFTVVPKPPVEPNPPAPLAVASRSYSQISNLSLISTGEALTSTSMTGAMIIRSKMSWAIRSPEFTASISKCYEEDADRPEKSVSERL